MTLTIDAQARAALAAAGITATTAESYGPAAIDVPVASWRGAHEILRDEVGLIFFDWLTASDELADGFRIVTHVADFWGGGHVEHLMVRTLVDRTAPRLESLTEVYAGADWHERETHEMFGVGFDGHPNLVPLLLPDGFEGHPLRKEFVLASRVAKPWPGAKEPGESDHAPKAGAPSRRRTLPPGVPDPQTWGPRPPGSPDPDPLAAAQSSAAPARPRRTPRAERTTPPAERATPPAGSPAPPVEPTAGPPEPSAPSAGSPGPPASPALPAGSPAPPPESPAAPAETPAPPAEPAE